jgi:hypothetical protein
MNLARAEKLLARFHVRDLHSKAKVPFLFKKNQKKLMAAAQKQQDAGKPIRIICDKARRTGCSSWAEGMLFCHALAIPDAYALIAAHQHRSSKALFSLPKGFAKEAPFLNLRAIERQIFFPHSDGDSIMEIVTAGKDTTGRGFTLSALHLSESAHYKGADIYSSVIPAVSKHKDTMIIIESTPKGMEGDGEAFYEMWMDAIEERSEYEPVFLSWLDDDACVADPSVAKDAPIDEEEKELLKQGVKKSQLAWRRLAINGPECGGLVELFHQEYPTNWEESFVSSGLPAFEESERQWASANIMEPKWRGFLDVDSENRVTMREHAKGDLAIWADPVPGHYYYIGADAARGDEDRKDTRDFAANVGFDGTTGLQAFRYCGYVVPERHAHFLDFMGLKYNQAMINGEITGGYGWTTLYTLRDLLGYPNLYRWKGKHDEVSSAANWRKSAWFETTSHTRTMLFEAMRLGLREAAMTEGEYGITIFDDMTATQIRRATRVDSGRIEIRKGHDDTLFGAMLANIAMRQWAPPRSPNSLIGTEDADEIEAIAKMKRRGHEVMNDPCHPPQCPCKHCADLKNPEGKIVYVAPVEHRLKIQGYNDRHPNVEDLEYVGGS